MPVSPTLKMPFGQCASRIKANVPSSLQWYPIKRWLLLLQQSWTQCCDSSWSVPGSHLSISIQPCLILTLCIRKPPIVVVHSQEVATIELAWTISAMRPRCYCMKLLSFFNSKQKTMTSDSPLIFQVFWLFLKHLKHPFQIYRLSLSVCSSYLSFSKFQFQLFDPNHYAYVCSPPLIHYYSEHFP